MRLCTFQLSERRRIAHALSLSRSPAGGEVCGSAVQEAEKLGTLPN